jgi:hypothetical protein
VLRHAYARVPYYRRLFPHGKRLRVDRNMRRSPFPICPGR